MKILPLRKTECQRVKSGFTLIELAVVMVIIGLLVAGIMTGATLIDSADKRDTIRTFEEIKLSIKAFRLKYNTLPGDMANATTIWGQIHIDGVTNNGNGDGFIDMCGAETRRVFEHLTLAGLIKGEYDTDGAPTQDAIGRVFPATKYANHGIKVGYHDLNAPYQQFNRVHTAGFGQAGFTCLGTAPIVHSASSLWEIDRKFDDGLPTRGQIGGYFCLDSWVTEIPNYNNAATCGMAYKVD